jgi:hypothetical protein
MAQGVTIAGTGSYLPEKILTNDDLSKFVETSDEWIVTRTGIKERRIAGEGESTSHLGSKAGQKASRASRHSSGRPRPYYCRHNNSGHTYPRHGLLRPTTTWSNQGRRL